MSRRLCSECGERPPRFRVQRGKPKVDATHGLCGQCWQAEIERSWARKRANEQAEAA
jgi:hypothetical protein